jgi:hypothetical protein
MIYRLEPRARDERRQRLAVGKFMKVATMRIMCII